MNLLLPLYAFVGLLEWSLALTRTIFTIRENKVIVPITVMLETFVALLVFKNFIQTDDWMIALAYSFGSGAGSLLPMLLLKRKRSV